MTEPREPEPNVGEDESTQPIQARPDAAGWYPVEAAKPQSDDPTAPEPADNAPATEGPAAGADDEATRVMDSEPEPVIEPESSPDEPTAVRTEPEAVGEPESAPEPAISDSEPTAVVGEPEPTAVVGDSQPTAVVGEPEPTAVVGEPEPTAVVGDSEPTAVIADADARGESTPVPRQEAANDAVPAATGPTESIFRQPSPATGSSPEPEPTRMEQLSDEEQKLAAERAARRDARAAALAAPAPQPLAEPAPVIIHKRTNDKFWGAFGLFLLRLVLAAIFAIRGLNLLTDIPAAQAMFARTIIPEPGTMAIVTGVSALLIAISLVLGLLTRLAGLGVTLIAGGALVFVYWGNWSPFIAGRPGFLGEFELLVATVGVLLMCIGGGGWSLDRSFRAGREQDKAERASAAE